MTAEKVSTRKITMLSMLTACGLILFVFESFLPIPLWFRPGFGNIATILALMFFGFGDAVKVTVLRVVVGALILGRLFSPAFVFALSGGLASTIVMAYVWKFTGKIFGPVGISVLGAVAHNTVQLSAAYLLFVKSAEIFIFLPVFIAAGVVTGTATGLISAIVFEKSGKRLGFEFIT